MISQLSIGFSEFFVILLKLIKWSRVIKIFKHIVVNITDKDVTNIKNDGNNKADEETCFRIKYTCAQDQNYNCYDQQTCCQNNSCIDLES